MAIIEIRVGSKSDFPRIAFAEETLKELAKLLDVQDLYKKRILSAHRIPQDMAREAQALKEKGYKVCIASAGGSAHLAGMTASETQVPVVALPVSTLGNGLDALLSMIQMPPGKPNACVGIDQGKDAAILATTIAYFADKNMREMIAQYQSKKLVGEPTKIPKVNLICKEGVPPNATQMLDELGIPYGLNEQINSFVPTIYFASLEKIHELIDTTIDHIAILAPSKENDPEYDFSDLAKTVKGPYAWAGLNRETNASLLAAKFLAIDDENIYASLEKYSDTLADAVRNDDASL